jgi:hypothetical protein
VSGERVEHPVMIHTEALGHRGRVRGDPSEHHLGRAAVRRRARVDWELVVVAVGRVGR